MTPEPITLPVRRSSWTADELLSTTFPPAKWAVPHLLCEGLNVVVSPPKVGKSWLALGLAVAVASGGVALGRIAVDPGDVLYLALEDTPRRLQGRLRALLRDDGAPDRLTITVECEAMTAGGAERIAAWLAAHPDARLVVVDVFAKVRGAVDHRATDSYSADYAAVGILKTLADRFGVAVLLVHHTRKASADDYLDTVSGTNGIAGAADAVLVLSRARNTTEAKLSITGRDVEEAEYALTFDAQIGTWTLLDAPASDVDLTDERRRIVTALRDREGLGPKAIAETTGLSHDVVKQLVRRMVDAQQLDTDGSGHYFAPGVTPFTIHSVHPFTGESERGEQSDAVDQSLCCAHCGTLLDPDGGCLTCEATA